MKKIGFIVLLFILILQSGGMLFVYKLQQCGVKYEMASLLKNSHTSFEKIILPIEEYQKSEINSGEIMFNGNIYDVKSVVITASKAELLVINDDREKSILGKIKDFIKDINQPFNGNPDQLLQFLTLNYILPDMERIFFVPTFIAHIFRQIDSNFTSPSSDISSPPPRVA